MAARRVLGPGAPAVRDRRRQIEELITISASVSTPAHNGHAPPHQLAPHGHGYAPDISVARGQLSTVELAALVTVLAARHRLAQAAGVRPEARSEWSARSRLVRSPVTAGASAWRASALPR
ncbi:MAG: acyl-CoA carboxylase subunit epsilon [Streptosporangiaceae bacterium]